MVFNQSKLVIFQQATTKPPPTMSIQYVKQTPATEECTNSFDIFTDICKPTRAVGISETTFLRHICKQHMQSRSNVNSKKYFVDGKTMLHWAVYSQHKTAVEYLLFLKADPDIPDNEGLCPLISAATDIDVEMVKILIEAKCNIDVYNDSDVSILQLCNTNPTNMRTLIESGFDVTGENGLKALIGASYTCAELLITAKANVNGICPEYHETPLAVACQVNNVKMAKLLCEAGKANIDMTFNKNNNCAIHMCLHQGRGEVLQYLVNKGANINAVTRDGNNALMLLALQKSHWRVNVNDFIHIFFTNGIDITNTNVNGCDVFDIVVAKDNMQFLQKMLGYTGFKNKRSFVVKMKNLANTAYIQRRISCMKLFACNEILSRKIMAYFANCGDSRALHKVLSYRNDNICMRTRMYKRWIVLCLHRTKVDHKKCKLATLGSDLIFNIFRSHFYPLCKSTSRCALMFEPELL